jgi:DNA repair protein SbcC/Rad50
MIPIQLTIKGLYSYQEKQTIDFTKLTAANLFGIFGTVGSGKSSILEAITFAIYGRTDRLNLSGDNRYYNMMNLKSDELLIDFIFETGKNQTAYRATVKGKRNSRNFDEVKTLERSAYRKNGNDWLPVETENLEAAIGLSYDNFKRTIIIPQGQFQEFLQLGNKDRTQMMKELFNLAKFEFYNKVASLETKNNAQKQNIGGQLQQLGEPDPEQLKAFEAQLVQFKKEIEELDVKLKSQTEKDKQWQQIQELAKKLEAAGKSLSELKKRSPLFRKWRKNWLSMKNVFCSSKTGLKHWMPVTIRFRKKLRSLKTIHKNYKRRKQKSAGMKRTLLEIKPDYESRELLKQRAEELGKVVQIVGLESKTAREKERLAKGGALLLETSVKIENLKVERENLIIQIKDEKQKLPDLALLSEVKTWHVQKENLEKQKSETEKEKIKLENEGKALKQLVDEILCLPIFDGFSEKQELQKAIQHLLGQVELKKQEIKNIETESTHLRVKAQLEKYAQTLHDGEPCPLCGSLHHPEIYSAAGIREELNRLENSKSEVEKVSEKISDTINKIRTFDTQINQNEKVLAEWTEKQNQNRLNLETHFAQFKWPGFEIMAEVNNAFNTAGNIQKEIKNKETQLEEIGGKLEAAQKDKERFQTEIEKIKTAITEGETELKTLQGQLKLVSTEQVLDKTAVEIDAERKALLEKYVLLEKQFNSLTEKLTELRKAKDMLSGSLTANKQELELEQKINSGLLTQLKEQLQQSQYQSVAEVQQILAQSIDTEKQKQLLAGFKQNLALANSRVEELQAEMGARVYDAETHRKVKDEIPEIEKSKSVKNKEIGKTEELLIKLKKDIENQAVLQKQLEQLELRAENIKTMKSLFKASGFVNYISSVYLQNLCNAANDRFFQLTRQKLSLEITPTTIFRCAIL